MQQYAGIIRVLIVLLVKTKHERLNHKVGESVGSSSKGIGYARIHIFIVTRIGGQLTGNKVWTNNVA